MPNAWPATLPQYLLLDGASLGIGDGLAEYQPDTGPPISRRRTAAVVRPLTGSMILSDAQVSIFEAFFVDTLMNGALPFTFPDPRTRATVLVKFTKRQLPAMAPRGGDNYQISLNLLVLP